MSGQLTALVNAAGTAAAAGRWQEAEGLWRQVRDIDPDHVQALFSLGVHAFQRGDKTAALELLQAAQARSPRDAMIPATIARIHRDAGRTEREWSAIVDSLSLDPYFLPALLSKGEFLRRQRKSKAAAAVFRDVLKVAAGESQWPQALRRRLEAAREAVRSDTAEFESFLGRRVIAERARIEGSVAARWDEAVSILSGRSRPYHAECNRLHIPRLPALTFHDPSMFPWIPDIEARTAEIKQELEQLVAQHFDEFTPYVAYGAGDPVNQWQELNHSRAWSSYHLWAHGQPVTENLARCPRTAEALQAIEAVDIAGLCPNAMFSALAPHTRIPPHSGETNARLVAHLPLVVPEDCSFRVGHDWREWEEGRVMVFDDSIEHEARNDSERLRVVLIFDVWNPSLSVAERDMVTALAAAERDYRTAADA